MREIKKQLGYHLAIARMEKDFDLLYVANAIQLAPVQIEHLELGHYSAHWKKYEKMLKLYGKKVKLTLVDDKGETQCRN